MRHIDKIIIHCTATPRHRDVTVTEIDSWHRARGWNGIGYHYLIRLDGTIETGRPIELAGAHCRGQNSRSVGIAYAGGLETDGHTPADTRTPQQRAALRTLVGRLLTLYPGSSVHGHNEFSSKKCPCFNVSVEFNTK